MSGRRWSLPAAWALARAHLAIVRPVPPVQGMWPWLRRGSLLVAVLIALQALSAPPAPPVRAETATADARWGEMPLHFIANQGQMDSRVAYYVQGSDKVLYFTPEGVTFALSTHAGTAATDVAAPLPSEQLGQGRERWIVKLDFVGAHAPRPRGRARASTTVSYFTGAPDEWHTGVPTYAEIVYPDLWDGVDLAYSGTVNRLKHEFVVRPGADPAAIRLAYRGAAVRINAVGQLEVSTPLGGFYDDAPVAYQEVDGRRVPVAVGFELDDAAVAVNEGLTDTSRAYGFRVGAYDPALPLVIDPAMIVYCGYIGGSGIEFGTAIAVDAAGSAYVTGYTDSAETTFPVAVGPDLTINGTGFLNTDAFVAKVKADGTGLVYAGYIGGGDDDWGSGIAVDARGSAYVIGSTVSTQATFPVTVGPDLTFNSTASDAKDAFVAKVKADGTGLEYCGYVGGSSGEIGQAIALDAAGSAYLTGYTTSSQRSFPVTRGPDLTFNGIYDAYVVKVKADGTGLDYAGYIGGEPV